MFKGSKVIKRVAAFVMSASVLACNTYTVSADELVVVNDESSFALESEVVIDEPSVGSVITDNDEMIMEERPEVSEQASDSDILIEDAEQEDTAVEEVTIEEPELNTVLEDNGCNEWDGITTEKTYEQDQISYVFTIKKTWKGGFNGSVRIYNNGDDTIENWALRMNYPVDITNLWNAIIEDNADGKYTIMNAAWNSDIKPGRSVEYGFTVRGDFEKFPESFEMLGVETEQDKQGYTVEYFVDNEWKSGFTGRIVITNTSDSPIEDWTLSFTYDREIRSIWSATIESHEGNRYVIKNKSYNANIKPGESVSFGFNGKGGSVSDEPYQYQLHCVSLNENENEIDSEKDSDEDGVPHYIEEYYCTDKRMTDTDGDGLTDLQEIILGTDPIKIDTYNHLLDTDGDGITDLDEISVYNTDPYSIDMDDDGLSDYEELFTYDTLPDNEDTDSDGLSDGFEIEHGLNPNAESSDGKVLDSEIELEQELAQDSMSLAVKDDSNVAKPELYGKVSGELSKKVFIASATDSAIRENPAIIGRAIYIDGEDDYISGLTLSFNLDYYDGDISTSFIVAVNDDGTYEPIETSVENNMLTCVVHGSGTYAVLDVVVFMDYLGIDIDEGLIDYINGSVEELTNDEYDIIDEIETKTRPVGILSMEKRDFKKERLPVIKLTSNSGEQNSVKVRGQADIVFVIDTTSSMSGAISNVKKNIRLFAECITKEYNINARYALIDYRDIEEDGVNTTRVFKNGKSNWYTDIETFASKLNNLWVSGGGDTPECAIDALETARRLDYRKDVDKFIVLVTDANYKNANNYGVKNMQEEIEYLEADGISVSVVSNPLYQSYYQELIERTGGLFADINSKEFEAILIRLADLIGEETQSGSWVILKHGYRYVKVLDETDQDGDGLLTKYEMGNKEEINLTVFIRMLLMRSGIPASAYKGRTSIVVYNAKSDPTNNDTDDDGIVDGDGLGGIVDDAPWVKGYADGTIGEIRLVATTGDSSIDVLISLAKEEDENTGHAFLAYKSYVNDTFDLSGWNMGYCKNDKGWNELEVDNEPRYFSIKSNEWFTFSAGGIGGKGSAKCAVYNMEIYKIFSPSYFYSYIPNAYKKEFVNQIQLDKAFINMEKEAKKKYTVLHNCTHVSLGVWNKMYNAIINPTALNTPTNLYNWMIRHDSDKNFDLYKELM